MMIIPKESAIASAQSLADLLVGPDLIQLRLNTIDYNGVKTI